MRTLQRLPVTSQLAWRCCVANSGFRRSIAFSHGSTTVSDDKDTSHTSTEDKKSSPANTGKGEKDTDKKTFPSSETSKAKEGNHKYDSLKFYREGPNPESGELDPKAGSEEVKKHNKSVTERHNKA